MPNYYLFRIASWRKELNSFERIFFHILSYFYCWVSLNRWLNLRWLGFDFNFYDLIIIIIRRTNRSVSYRDQWLCFMKVTKLTFSQQNKLFLCLECNCCIVNESRIMVWMKVMNVREMPRWWSTTWQVMIKS